MDTNVVKETTSVDSTPTGSTQTKTFVSKKVLGSDFFVSKTNQAIFSIVGIIDILILIRFFMLLLGAARTGFVELIIQLTEIFVLPFKGIFPSPNISTGYFETASVIAIFMWIVIAWVISLIVGLFSTKTTSEV